MVDKCIMAAALSYFELGMCYGWKNCFWWENCLFYKVDSNLYWACVTGALIDVQLPDGKVHRRSRTVGMIDMGGGSVQIAYEVTDEVSYAVSFLNHGKLLGFFSSVFCCCCLFFLHLPTLSGNLGHLSWVRLPQLQSYKCVLGLFVFFVTHRTLTWITGSLKCVRDHSHACVYTFGLGTPTASQHNIFDSEKLEDFLVLLTANIFDL